MKPSLEEINNTYLLIQDYISPPPGYFEESGKEKGQEFSQKMAEYAPLYQSALDKFNAVSLDLSPGEVIEGYRQGCRLLRANLGGHMYHHFDEAYIPVMIEAIRDDDSPAFLFLQVLVRYPGEELASLAIDALDSKYARTRQAALSVVQQLELVEAVAKVRALIDDPDVETTQIAKNILCLWEEKGLAA